MIINRFLKQAHLKDAALILAIGTLDKYERIFEDERKLTKLFLLSLNLDSVISIVSDSGELIGVCCYRLKNQYSIRIKFKHLIRVFGIFKGIYKYYLFNLLESYSFDDHEVLTVDSIAINKRVESFGADGYLLRELEAIAQENKMDFLRINVIKSSQAKYHYFASIGFKSVRYFGLSDKLINKFGFNGYYYMLKIVRKKFW